jgi:hypothetical protein
MARLFGRGPIEVPRALRGSALAARGYVAIGAAHDAASGHDLVWGCAP